MLAATSFVCCCNVYSGTTYGGGVKTHGVYSQTTSDSSSGELDQKVERLGCEESLPDGIHFLSKDGKSISKQDVESFAVWGKDLRSVAAVVVKIPVDEVGGTLGVDGLKEMLKIDAYKKNLFSNPEGTWHLGEWGRKDSVALYVIEQWRFSKSKVWKADNLDAIVGNRHFMQMPDDKPIVFKDLAHDAIPPFSKKVISARDLNRVRNELWKDKDFAAKCKEAHDAAKNIQGDITRTAPPVQPEPSLFPELDHLKEQPLFPELEHLKHRNAEKITEVKPRRNVHQERRTPQRRNTSKEGSYYGGEQFGITDESVYDPDKFEELKMVIARNKSGAIFEGNQIETDKLQYIDTGKFESLIKDLINERIALLKEMLAKGKESAKSYIPLLNDNAAKLRDVFADIVSKINEAYTSVPEREMAAESIFKSIFLKYESLCNEVDKLQNDVETRGIGRFEDIPLSARQQNALEAFYMKRR